MEIRDFAEQVLMGTTLEDKLVSPEGEWTDRSPGIPLRIERPGRPAGLGFGRGGEAPPPPGGHRLEDDRDRGRLLHFLANHELLATELMALVLLKFPEAPPDFRRGVLLTLREEQAHTRLYLDRMRACGVEFGTVPLSGYFWRMVAPMESPMDFVSRLSLTFEQANLDYSRTYARHFARAGDPETAAILEQVYRDEIGHVRHGLQWFRRWKDPADSDWDAWRRCLPFPLSPERARSNHGEFNRGGRLAAGLDEGFIDRLLLHRQSRGRSPVVHWFHPGAEAELASGPDGDPDPVAESIALDLESLLLPLARHEDVVLLRRLPSPELERELIGAGFDLPECLTFPGDVDFAMHPLRERKLKALAPWAWTPRSRREAAGLEDRCARPPTDWVPGQSRLFGKSWARERLAEWQAGDPPPEWMQVREPGRAVTDVFEVEAALVAWMDRWEQARFKPEFGAAGRGQRRFGTAGLSEADRAWLRQALSRGPGWLEPELDRISDLGFQYDLGEDGLRFLGWTRSLVAPGGRYLGARLGDPFGDLPSGPRRFLLERACARLHAAADWLGIHLEPALRSAGHEGPIGVDVMAYSREQDLALHPMVELNPRFTLGHVALRLEKRLAPGCRMAFRLRSRREVQSAGFRDFIDWAEERRRADPCEFAADGRLRRGFVSLADPTRAGRLFPALESNLDL